MQGAIGAMVNAVLVSIGCEQARAQERPMLAEAAVASHNRACLFAGLIVRLFA